MLYVVVLEGLGFISRETTQNTAGRRNGCPAKRIKLRKFGTYVNLEREGFGCHGNVPLASWKSEAASKPYRGIEAIISIKP